MYRDTIEQQQSYHYTIIHINYINNTNKCICIKIIYLYKRLKFHVIKWVIGNPKLDYNLLIFFCV